MALPPEVLSLTEMGPVEDILLANLRPLFQPHIPVKTRVAKDQDFPLILVRRGDSFGDWRGESRFLDQALVVVHTFASGPDADEDAALLAEAVRVGMYQSVNNVIPGMGHITKVKMLASPRRAPDWVTATGPVQYADLPTGVERYETRYNVWIKRPDVLSHVPPPL